LTDRQIGNKAKVNVFLQSSPAMHTLSLAKVPHQYDKILRRYMMVQHTRCLNYQLCDKKKERAKPITMTQEIVSLAIAKLLLREKKINAMHLPDNKWQSCY
jgi:hypothetical protein